MATAKKKAADPAPVKAAAKFEKSQLLYCKALGASPDIVAAILTDGESYTIEEAKTNIAAYLDRKVG